MRENGVLSYLLGDHLGSTSIQMDDVGNVLAEQRYLPYGGVRFITGSMNTDYQYTGQRAESVLGLYDYKARWYDPVLGRFLQPDTLVPNPGSHMAYDRYAYVYNNPMRYTDPSGYAPYNPEPNGICGVECWLRSESGHVWRSQYYLSTTYGWKFGDGFNSEQMRNIERAGGAIERYVHSPSNNRDGKTWIRENMGNAVFHLGGIPQKVVSKFAGKGTSLVFLKNDIWLSPVFSSKIIVHELAHTWDNNSGNGKSLPTWTGGGIADVLAKYVGGDPVGLRWINGTSGIPEENQFGKVKPYGNHSSADYFAETFTLSIYNNIYVPEKAARFLANIINPPHGMR